MALRVRLQKEETQEAPQQKMARVRIVKEEPVPVAAPIVESPRPMGPKDFANGPPYPVFQERLTVYGQGLPKRLTLRDLLDMLPRPETFWRRAMTPSPDKSPALGLWPIVPEGKSLEEVILRVPEKIRFYTLEVIRFELAMYGPQENVSFVKRLLLEGSRPYAGKRSMFVPKQPTEHLPNIYWELVETSEGA